MKIGLSCFIAALISVAPSYAATSSDTGDGILHNLSVTQDVWIERPNKNYNYLDMLLVAKHPQFPLKRSLVQFENLPATACSAEDIRIAKMYLYFRYAHKAGWHSPATAPNVTRPLAVQRVLQEWDETQASSTQRMSGVLWSQPYLGLDNTDAQATPQSIPTYYHAHRPSGYMEFDVTRAVKDWANGAPNHGLLIWAMNEYIEGRDIRFYSKEHKDRAKRPILKVLCDN